MGDNIFLKEMKEIQFEDYFKYDAKCRGNLGDELPVMVYRMLEYSLKDELKNRFGKEVQIEVFRSAGRKAGEYFAKNMLDLDVPLDQFVNEETGKIILTVAEDADCSGLPVLGETVCNYDEGFIAGILSLYSGKPYTAVEVDCWATGDRVCRFHADVQE